LNAGLFEFVQVKSIVATAVVLSQREVFRCGVERHGDQDVVAGAPRDANRGAGKLFLCRLLPECCEALTSVRASGLAIGHNAKVLGRVYRSGEYIEANSHQLGRTGRTDRQVAAHYVS
jgi:hypothetical protein